MRIKEIFQETYKVNAGTICIGCKAKLQQDAICIAIGGYICSICYYRHSNKDWPLGLR